jgi:hypothetical protein
MSHTLIGILGAALVATTWLSVIRTVFTPRQRSSVLARGTVRVVAAVIRLPARRTRGELRERIQDLCTPTSLLATGGIWVAATGAGFSLLAWAFYGSPASLYSTPSGDAALAAAALLSGTLMLAAFTTHLIAVMAAYTRREGLVTRLAARATQTPDADFVLADYMRTGSRDHLDEMFAEWSTWLADVQTTHLSYPAIAYMRPFGSLCWAKAALIVLDCAAIAEATAPDWAPPNTRPLLTIGGYCLPRLARQLGEREDRFPVSYHGREMNSFRDTYRLAVKAGLPAERSEVDAEAAFIRLRIDYAPYVIAIGERLLYPAHQVVSLSCRSSENS